MCSVPIWAVSYSRCTSNGSATYWARNRWSCDLKWTATIHWSHGTRPTHYGTGTTSHHRRTTSHHRRTRTTSHHRRTTTHHCILIQRDTRTCRCSISNNRQSTCSRTSHKITVGSKLWIRVSVDTHKPTGHFSKSDSISCPRTLSLPNTLTNTLLLGNICSDAQHIMLRRITILGSEFADHTTWYVPLCGYRLPNSKMFSLSHVCPHELVRSLKLDGSLKVVNGRHS